MFTISFRIPSGVASQVRECNSVLGASVSGLSLDDVAAAWKMKEMFSHSPKQHSTHLTAGSSETSPFCSCVKCVAVTVAMATDGTHRTLSLFHSEVSGRSFLGDP